MAVESSPPRDTRKPDARERFLDNAQLVIERRIDDGILSLGDLSMRKLAGRSVSPTTAQKYFTDQYDVCAALVTRYRLAGGAPPDVIQQGATVHYNRVAREPEAIIAAGLRLKRKTVKQAEEVLTKARRHGSGLHRIQAAASLAEAHVAAAERTNASEASIDHFEIARQVADEGLSWVDENEIPQVEAAIDCAAIAAHASRMLSRGEHVAAKYLSFVGEYKAKEAGYARRLHLHSRSAVAQFHADRADALIKDDPRRSLSAFLVVAEDLQRAQNEGEWIDPNYLAMLIARLCSEQLAYPKHFGEAHRNARERLASLFPRSHTRSNATRETSKTLIRVVDSAPDYDIEIRAVDMLRVGIFGAVGHLCIARVLRKMYLKSAEPTDSASASDNSREPADPQPQVAFVMAEELKVKPQDYLVAALAYYQRAQKAMRTSGSAGILREQALAEHHALSARSGDAHTQSTNLPPMSTATIDAIKEAIDQLVMVGMVTERATPRQQLGLQEILEPVYAYITNREGMDPELFQR